MIKRILISILILFIATFFIYENLSFNSYVTQHFKNDMNIPINPNAPVKSSDIIEINAPIDSVWQVLTQINKWPSWQKDVTEANLLGELKEGTQFKWKAGGLSFNSKIHTIVPKHMFGWTGKTIGASAIHNWTFEDKGNKTIVKVEESLQGVFPRLLGGYFQRNLDTGVKTNLEELKIASEAN